MQDQFYEAIKIVFKHEGGFVDDPVDPGGATNFGVSLRYLSKIGEIDADGDGILDGDFDGDGDVDADDIRAMSREDAVFIYRRQWWDRYEYGTLPPAIATKVFDLAINMGARQAHCLLQRAACAAGEELADDGVIGPVTKRALWRIDAASGNSNIHPLLAAFRSEAAGFYRELIARNSSREKYRKGWLLRAYA
jgi:lysozyme family protein